MRLSQVETPALVLDATRLRHNLARMSARAETLGVDLRPHMKTAKSAEIARLATAGHSGAITVSTLKEAACFHEAGFTDILYAVAVSPAKLERVAAMRAAGAALKVVTDQLEVARAIAAAAARLDAGFEVYIEIDCGDRRSGLPADSDALIALGRSLDQAPGVTLAGVMTHGGQSYQARTTEAHRQVAESERSAVVSAAERLRAAGIPVPRVSLGSTPTAVYAAHLEGVDEFRPGVYMFGDLFQAEIGACGMDDLALSVATTVVGCYEARGEAVVDAGALALSKDRSTAEAPHDYAYGAVRDLSLEELPASSGLQVVRVSQEHGVVAAPEGAAFPAAALVPGRRLRILPNHACLTAAPYETYQVIEGMGDPDPEVIAQWLRITGW
jgi:D-serine deaminase-like pyridoxal phosphate-dependent protein